jgi:hypothetical protein
VFHWRPLYESPSIDIEKVNGETGRVERKRSQVTSRNEVLVLVRRHERSSGPEYQRRIGGAVEL